jgi:hypothetical protein
MTRMSDTYTMPLVTEGVIVGLAFAATPVIGIAAIIGVGLYEYYYSDRDKIKKRLNSLD